MNTFLTAKNLSKTFERPFTKQSFVSLFSGRLRKRLSIHVFSDTSLHITSGTCTRIVGKNGSGKTTLLKIIAGVYAPSSGTLEVSGSICPLLFAGPMMYGNLEVFKNIVHFLMLYGFSKSVAESSTSKILEALQLIEKQDHLFSQLSRGEQCAVTILTALETNHDLFVIDELFDPLSPAIFSIIHEKIREKIAKGSSLIFTTHNEQTAQLLEAKQEILA
jgi:ABC-type multidrug transport system ATPase subunit